MALMSWRNKARLQGPSFHVLSGRYSTNLDIGIDGALELPCCSWWLYTAGAARNLGPPVNIGFMQMSSALPLPRHVRQYSFRLGRDEKNKILGSFGAGAASLVWQHRIGHCIAFSVGSAIPT